MNEIYKKDGEMSELQKKVKELRDAKHDPDRIRCLQEINELLLTKYAIRIGDLKVVPLWVETYYYDKDKFCDENTHKSPMQKNRSGLAALNTHGVRYGLLDNTRDIWLRDFMPVRRRDGKYVSFRYDPSYLKDIPQLRTDFRQDISGQFWTFDPAFGRVVYSDINLDGGNIVFSPSREKVIVSDRVFLENPEKERKALVRELKNLLGARIIIIPSLPSDLTGHADGMVRFVDEDTVIGNAAPYLNGLEQRVKSVLEREGFHVIDFPCYLSPKGSAAGCYLNYLETDKHIFLPVFGGDMDEKAIRAAEELFTRQVVPVQINEIAKEGGCLNCISWELNIQGTGGEDIPLVPCPVCEGEVGALYGICPRCGWEYDGVTEDAMFSSANGMTLGEYKNSGISGAERRIGIEYSVDDPK